MPFASLGVFGLVFGRNRPLNGAEKWFFVLRFFGMYPAMGVALYRRGVMDNLAR